MLKSRLHDYKPQNREAQTFHITGFSAIRLYTIRTIVLFCSLAVLDPRFDHTMGVLSPFILVWRSWQDKMSTLSLVSRLSTWRYPHLTCCWKWALAANIKHPTNRNLIAGTGAGTRSLQGAQQHTATVVDRWDRQTIDKQTPDRYIDPAL